jgi:sugar diacid utilization regulator
MANRMRIPLFTFESAYMEDLIISGNELLKSKLRYLVFEEKISNLIDTSPTSHTVKTIAHEINPSFYSQVICAYLTPKGSSGFSAISSYFQRLLYKRYQTAKTTHYSYIKYRQGMILLFSFEETLADIKDVLFNQLKKIDLDPALFHIGITDSPTSLDQLDRCVSQATYSNRYCQLNQSNFEFYSSLGVYQFIIPLLYTPSLLATYEKSIQALKTYDAKFTSNLLDTLITYINCNGSITETAHSIFQHQNTVRYRLQKIASLLDCSEKDFYPFCLILIKIYLIDTHSTI